MNDYTEVHFFMDGDSWCATYADFVNLMESPAGFGDTPAEAVAKLQESDNRFE